MTRETTEEVVEVTDVLHILDDGRVFTSRIPERIIEVNTGPKFCDPVYGYTFVPGFGWILFPREYLGKVVRVTYITKRLRIDRKGWWWRAFESDT